MIGIYARQSVDKKDSISIESQIDFCRKEFAGEDYKVYTDKGFSGKDTNRPAFEKMINDIDTGLIEKVIVYKLDRISRSVLDFATIIGVFKKHEVSFISSTEKFDTSTPIGNAMLSIIMVFAQLERETIQKRIKDNYYARGRKGFYMGGRSPYGFSKIETRIEGIKTSTFEVDAGQMSHLIKMYELYANTDMSLGKVSDFMNQKNIPAAEGGRWDSCKLSRILRNPVYVKADAEVYSYYKSKGCIISNGISDFTGINGCYLYGKREINERKYSNVENHVVSIGLHQGAIDSKTWLLCQFKLDTNKQIKNSGKGKYSWLSGIAKCGYCGYAVSVVKAGHADNNYFNCRGKTNLKNCNGHSRPIRTDEVETIIEGYLLSKVQELKDTQLTVQTNGDITANRIRLQILKIDNQIENLVQQMAEANNVAMKYINERITELDALKNSSIEEVKKVMLTNSKNLPAGQLLDKIDNWKGLSLEEKKKISSCFIEKIHIKDDEISIDWKI
ncbi:MAG: recombinase family protein [Ruminiclostridium sp.]|nr:recombinase family protein [Ruminiclostridium sp.]